MLEEVGLDLLLSGHSHSYERSVLVKGHHGTTGECVRVCAYLPRPAGCSVSVCVTSFAVHDAG
jgi:hypothetical protein